MNRVKGYACHCHKSFFLLLLFLLMTSNCTWLQGRCKLTVNTQNTGHDDWNDRLHDAVGLHHTRGSDTNARLGSTVGGTEVCKWQET